MHSENLRPLPEHSASADAELLRHSLTEDDDTTGFNQPWNPWSLVVTTFFCGALPGIGLLAFNYERLGIKGRLYGTLAIAAALELCSVAVYFWVAQSGALDLTNRDDQRTLRTGVKVVLVVAALFVARTQQKRFRLFEHSGLPAGGLFKPLLIAVLLSLFIALVKGFLILPALLRK